MSTKDLCLPGSSECKKNMLKVCDINGLWIQTDCPKDTECSVKNNIIACIPITKEKNNVSEKHEKEGMNILDQLLNLTKDKNFVKKLKDGLFKNEMEDDRKVVKEDEKEDKEDSNKNDEEEEEDEEQDSNSEEEENEPPLIKKVNKKSVNDKVSKLSKRKKNIFNKQKHDSKSGSKKDLTGGHRPGANKKIKTVIYRKKNDEEKKGDRKPSTVTVVKTVIQKEKVKGVDVELSMNKDKQLKPNISINNGYPFGNLNTNHPQTQNNMMPAQTNGQFKASNGSQGGGSSSAGGQSKSSGGSSSSGGSTPGGGGQSKSSGGGPSSGGSTPGGGGQSKSSGGSSSSGGSASGGGGQSKASGGSSSSGGGQSKTSGSSAGGGGQSPSSGGSSSSGGGQSKTSGGSSSGGGGQSKTSGGSSSGGGGSVNITADQVNEAMSKNEFQPKTEYVEAVIKVVNEELSDLNEAAMFLAQTGHESGGFQHIEEIDCAGSTTCADQYGGSEGAPGKSYHGRGFIQLSWPANYKEASEALGMGDELFQNPEKVAEDPEIGAKVSIWFWKEKVEKHEGYDKTKFGTTTKAINGALECTGSNVEKSKKRYDIYKSLVEVLGISDPASEDGCY